MDNNKASKNSVTRQFFKLMFLSGAIFIAALAIIILLIAWFQRSHILDQFSHHLQHRLNVDLQVESLSFGVIRSFPTATVTAQGVKLQRGNQGDPFFVDTNAESVQLHFNILDVLKKEYRVNRLTIKNGHVIASFDPDHLKPGQPGNPETQNSNLKFDLRRLLLYNITFQYINPGEEQNILFLITQMHLNSASSERSEWEMDKSSIVFNDYLFETAGTFIYDEETVLMDAAIHGNNFRIESVINDLPESLVKELSPYSPKGKLTFTSLLQGQIASGQTPRISADFVISNGSIAHPEKSLKLDRVSLEGHYTNGDNRTAASSKIKLQNVRASTGSGKITGAVSIKNLHRPLLEIDLIADVSAGDLVAWTGLNGLKPSKGNVKADLFFAGRMNSDRRFSGSDLLAADIRGDVNFHDLRFSTENSQLDYHNFTGAFYLAEDQLLVIHELSGKAGQSDINLSGTVYNLLPYLFIDNEYLFIEATLSSEALLLDELLLQNGQSANDDNYSLSFPKYLHLSLKANVGQLTFRRFKADSILAETTLIDRKLFAENLTFNTMDGNVLMTGNIDASQKGDIQLNTRADLIDVDIHQLFYQTGNFGQSSIVDENLYGYVTAEVEFLSSWSPALQIRWDSMVTNASLTIENGRLVNYQPMQALGRFIRAGDLNDVAFSTLKNQIYIHNKKVLIPMMEVNSNILDLELSGEHSFGNEIDYRLRVELSELLAGKHRESRNPQEQFGDIIDDGLGRTTLFLKLTGTTQDVVVRYDQEGVREKLREDFREERENLRDILRDEFRSLSRRSPDTTTVKDDRQKEREQIRKQEEEGFIIEWD